MKLKCFVINQSVDNIMNCKLNSFFLARRQICFVFLWRSKKYPLLEFAAKDKRISIFVLGDNCLPSWLQQKWILDYVTNCTLCLLQSNSALHQQTAQESDALCNSDWGVETFISYCFCHCACLWKLNPKNERDIGTIWNVFLELHLFVPTYFRFSPMPCFLVPDISLWGNPTTYFDILTLEFSRFPLFRWSWINTFGWDV